MKLAKRISSDGPLGGATRPPARRRGQDLDRAKFEETHLSHLSLLLSATAVVVGPEGAWAYAGQPSVRSPSRHAGSALARC